MKSEDVEGAVPTVEMADVYRSLVTNLKDKLGGTINDANADAIAHAAAQVYRREVEPRLWEEKSAHELLDSLGVPRSGAFVPYSLGDRLLLLRRSDAEDPYRVQAHELLDELAVPRVDGTGREYPLQTRLTGLLGSLDGVPGLTPTTVDGGAGEAPNAAEAGDAGGGEEGQATAGGHGEVGAGPAGTDEATAGPELVDALEAIHRVVGPAGPEDPMSSPPPGPLLPPAAPPTSDLIGLGSLLGSIQEELLEVRQAVESLRQEVRDAVALIQAGGGPGLPPPVLPEVGPPDGEPETVVQSADDPSEASAAGLPGAGSPGTASDFVQSDSGSPNGEGGATGPPGADLGPPVPSEVAEPDPAPDEPVPGGRVGPHEPTLVLPAVPAAPDGLVLAEEPVAEEPPVGRRRSRRFALLVLLVVLVGVLLAAGITAAVVLGWDELGSRFLDIIIVPARGGPGAAP